MLQERDGVVSSIEMEETSLENAALHPPSLFFVVAFMIDKPQSY